MMTTTLSDSDKRELLRLAREAIDAAVRDQPLPPVDTARLSPALLRQGTCFVTLTESDELRGCIGGLQAFDPLYEDVRQHAMQSALRDYRFPPVTPEEVPRLEIEISVLTEPQPLRYDSPDDLIRRLRPEVDGVILSQGYRRATFLPQVWERVPDPETFLSMLCEKMGAPPDTWRRTMLDVQTYQVEKFTEAELSMHRA
jgi:AmmeMemoRadiSam system protein A